MLTRRVHVLLDDERFARLEARSRRTGASIGELVRRAVDMTYPAERGDLEGAVDDLLEAPPVPVEDWDAMKADMLDELSRGRA